MAANVTHYRLNCNAPPPTFTPWPLLRGGRSLLPWLLVHAIPMEKGRKLWLIPLLHDAMEKMRGLVHGLGESHVRERLTGSQPDPIPNNLLFFFK